MDLVEISIFALFGKVKDSIKYEFKIAYAKKFGWAKVRPGGKHSFLGQKCALCER